MEKMNMTEIKTKLKQVIVDNLNLEDISVEDIQDDAPLFVEGLGLDSLDAVELVMLVEKNFQVRIKDSETAKEAFQSITVLAKFIQDNQAI